MEKKISLKEFIKDRKVGTITLTSKYVVNDLLKKVDFEEAEIIVEYGAGSGVITRQILNRMKNNAVLFAFETNESFIEELIQIRDKRLVIVNADPEDAKMILMNRYKVKQTDYIISTIPFTLFDRRKRKRIVSKSYSMLKEKGKFITCQYSWLIYDLMKQQFTAATITATLLNIPPAFILEGVK